MIKKKNCKTAGGLNMMRRALVECTSTILVMTMVLYQITLMTTMIISNSVRNDTC